MADFPMIFTELAKQKLIEALETEPIGSFVRVAVKGGGCSGFKQTLEFDTEFDPEEDLEASISLPDARSARVITDSYSALYLAGTELDYVSESLSEGFKFVGGQAKSSCACGSSVKY